MSYIFPKKYIDPITDGFYGMYSKIKTHFKFGKKETDLKSEDLNNKNLNIENNPIFGDGVRIENNNQGGLQVENRYQNDDGFNNNNYPNSEKKNKPYEEKLDY
jgi:hypothetical protein